jgi:hypothetical protein
MNNNKSVEQKLKYLEKLLLKPKVRKSISELSEILCDEFVEFGSSGKIYNKKDIIKSLQNEHTSKMLLTNFKMNPLSKEHYLVTYKISKEENGKKIYSLRSSIWKKVKDKYQMIFHQGTIIST